MSQYNGSHRSVSSNSSDITRRLYTEDSNGYRTFLGNADIYQRHSQRIVIGPQFNPAANNRLPPNRHHRHHPAANNELPPNYPQQHQQQRQFLSERPPPLSQPPPPMTRHIDYNRYTPGGNGHSANEHGGSAAADDNDVDTVHFRQQCNNGPAVGAQSHYGGHDCDDNDDETVPFRMQCNNDAQSVCSRSTVPFGHAYGVQTAANAPTNAVQQTQGMTRQPSSARGRSQQRNRSRSPSGFTVCSSASCYQPGASKQLNKLVAIRNNIGYAVPSAIDRKKYAIIIDVDDQKDDGYSFFVVDSDDQKRWIKLSTDKVLKARYLCQPLHDGNTSEMMSIVASLSPYQIVTVMQLRDQRLSQKKCAQV